MNRCPYCGHRCYGRTCQYHSALVPIDREAHGITLPTMRDELRKDVKATKGKEA